MSASTPKKPQATGGTTTSTARRAPTSASTALTASNGIAPNRSPSRMASQTPTASPAAPSLGRERSVRKGAPVSARAAIRRPADPAVEDDAKAEMQSRLDELQEKLQQAELACEESQRQAVVLQLKLDEALKEQSILEERVQEHTERTEELENGKKESLRARRELEQIYESERVAMTKEKEEARVKEQEMHTAMQRMRETLAQREIRDRTGVEDNRKPSLSRTGSLRSNNNSPNLEPLDRQFAPSSSLHRSDSRSNSALVTQKDKVIESLRLELAESQIRLVELENKGGGRLHELEKDMYDVKMQNARLMEENESFQLLLSEKTLNGDFAHSDLLRIPSHNESRPPSRSPLTTGTTLADELGDHDSVEGEAGELEKKLQAEVNSLKDSNKALTLYINNIISRLLQHEQLSEAILNKTPDFGSQPAAGTQKPSTTEGDDDLPPPPPPKDEHLLIGEQPQTGAAGLLQRAKSVMGGKRPRPTSQIQPADQMKVDELKLHEHPATAPSIPLGRSNSTRGGGHRRANSEWSAANVVTSMYRGPSPGFAGPASPGLGSSTSGRTSFFAGPHSLAGAARSTSGSTVPVINELGGNKENEPTAPRDLKQPSGTAEAGIRNNRNSVAYAAVPPFNTDISHARPDSVDSSMEPIAISNPQAVTEVIVNPSSPPRSTASSGDKDSRSSGAVMMGSRPRPLRLVQEAQDDEKARKAANRGSWFGWMNKGALPQVGRTLSGEDAQAQQQ